MCDPKLNGPDDAIAIFGDAALWSVIDTAPVSIESARRDAEEAIQILRTERTRAKSRPDEIVIPDCDDAYESIAAIPDNEERTLFIGQLAAIKIPGLTKALIEKAVKRARMVTLEELELAKRVIEHEKYMRTADSPLALVRDLARYYALWRGIPPGAEVIEAVFAMNTYVFDVFDTTPYMLYDSATPGCGKTISLERHEAVCFKGYSCASPTPAVIFRRIDRDHGTFILDEAAWVQGRSDRAAEIMEIFNVGYKKGPKVPRCTDHGEGLADFDVYCPKVMARIGNFTGTLLSRGVLIHLTKAYGLPQSWRRRIEALARPLRERLKAYAVQYRKALEEMYEQMPDETYWGEVVAGRENELHASLLMHARLIAGLCDDEGKQFEREFTCIVRRFTAEKAKLTIAEDWRVGEALEVLEVLEDPLRVLLLTRNLDQEGWRDSEANRIMPGVLLKELTEKETWGAYLDKKKSDKAKTTAIGSFLRSFSPKSRHTETGTEYVLLDLAWKLAKHIPLELPEPPTVKSSERPPENFRTLLKKFEEGSIDSSFPGAGDTSSFETGDASFRGTTHTHNVPHDSQKDVKVSVPAATASSENSYGLTPGSDSGVFRASVVSGVSAVGGAGADTMTHEEARNFSSVSPENVSNEEVGDNPDTSTPVLGGMGSCVCVCRLVVKPLPGLAFPERRNPMARTVATNSLVNHQSKAVTTNSLTNHPASKAVGPKATYDGLGVGKSDRAAWRDVGAYAQWSDSLSSAGRAEGPDPGTGHTERASTRGLTKPAKRPTQEGPPTSAVAEVH